MENDERSDTVHFIPSSTSWYCMCWHISTSWHTVLIPISAHTLQILGLTKKVVDKRWNNTRKKAGGVKCSLFISCMIHFRRNLFLFLARWRWSVLIVSEKRFEWEVWFPSARGEIFISQSVEQFQFMRPPIQSCNHSGFESALLMSLIGKSKTEIKYLGKQFASIHSQIIVPCWIIERFTTASVLSPVHNFFGNR